MSNTFHNWSAENRRLEINLQCVNALFPTGKWISFGMTSLFVATEGDDEYEEDDIDDSFLEDVDNRAAGEVGTWYRPVSRNYIRQLIASWFIREQFAFSTAILGEVYSLAVQLRSVDHQAQAYHGPEDYTSRVCKNTINDEPIDIELVHRWSANWEAGVINAEAPLCQPRESGLTPYSEF
jgi:hypothetical protein